MEDKVGTVQFNTKQQQLQDKAWSVSQKQEADKVEAAFPGKQFQQLQV
jgi:hypothetical protein